MTTTRTAPRVLTALASGLTTTAWYATPDVLTSRTARAWVKAGLVAASVAVELPQLRAELASRRAAAAAAPDGRASTERSASADGSVNADGTVGADGAGGAPGTLGAERALGGDDVDPSRSRASRVRAVALGVLVAGVGVGSLAGTVAAERWLFQRGEARAAAGVRFAHTRAAVVLGALTVALSLIPSPADDEDAGDAGVRTS
ncbi:hypothetical protein AB6N24_18960 [Cellulomonas sp. 179-A 4D5 NHS]|uniref:hypothetical protein n=1 Tax=Cellulomonas sp. 179-A 4D5 NHS TaxID=3142378 RepID=UPI00399F4DEC